MLHPIHRLYVLCVHYNHLLIAALVNTWHCREFVTSSHLHQSDWYKSGVGGLWLVHPVFPAWHWYKANVVDVRVYIDLPTARTERLTSYLTGCEFTCQELTEFALNDLYALHRRWVSNFSLVIGLSQLTAMPFVGVLFTEGEFPTFLLWLAPHSSLPCPLLACFS